MVSAAAGVDASNTPEGTILLLPEDPDASARALAAGLRERLGVRVGVLVSDTLGRAWRDGQTDHAIGAGGVHVIEDLRGETDAEGRPLVVTMPCVADELAAAADLVKGKAARRPVAVVRGRADLVGSLDLPGARSIVRPLERDMFRLGADEAYAEGFAAGATHPLASAHLPGAGSAPADLAEQRRDRREHERPRGDPAAAMTTHRRREDPEPGPVHDVAGRAYMWLRLRSAPVAKTSATCAKMNSTK